MVSNDISIEMCDINECLVCSICLEKTDEENGVILKCDHSFHLNCLLKWCSSCKNEKKYPCPMCRQMYKNCKYIRQSSDNDNLQSIRGNFRAHLRVLSQLLCTLICCALILLPFLAISIQIKK